MGTRKCIICCQYELLDEDDDDEIIEIKSDETIQSQRFQKSQLSPILLLRTLLEIPQEMCTKFLKENGNPNSWIFWCNSCYTTLIKKAENVYHQIKLLEKQLSQCQTDIKKAIFRSENQAIRDKKSSCSTTDPGQLIRSYIIKNLKCVTNKETGVKDNQNSNSAKLDNLPFTPSLNAVTPGRPRIINYSENRFKAAVSHSEELKIISTRSLGVNQTLNSSNQSSGTFSGPHSSRNDEFASECITLESESDEECEVLSVEEDNRIDSCQNLTWSSNHKNSKNIEDEIQPSVSTPPGSSVALSSFEFDGNVSTIARKELAAFVTMFRKRRTELGYNQAKVGVSLGNAFGNIFSQSTISRFEKFQLTFTYMCQLKPYLQKWLDSHSVESNSKISASAANSVESNSEISASAAHSVESNLEISASTTHSVESNLEISASATHSVEVESNSEISASATSDQFSRRKRRTRTVIEGEFKKALENYFLKKPVPSGQEILELAEAHQVSKEVVRIWFANQRQKNRRTMMSIMNAYRNAEEPTSSNYQCQFPPTTPLYIPTAAPISPTENVISTPDPPHYTSTHQHQQAGDVTNFEPVKLENDEFILP